MSSKAVICKKTLGVLACISILFFVTCYDLPVNPRMPENAYCQLILKKSGNSIEQAYVEDTAGTIIGVGAIVRYPEYVDSIRINFVNAASEIVKTENIVTNRVKTIDTVWTYFTYPRQGMIKVNSIAYIQKSIQYRDSATIMFSYEQPNKAPTIRYTGSNSITFNDTCKLYISVSDSNPDQWHIVNALQKPANAKFENNIFTWKPDSNFTGVEQLVLVAADNGKPALADTLTIMIGVRSPSVVAKLSIATFTKDSVTMAWQAIDSAKLYYVYKSNTQIGNFNLYDSTVTSIYSDSLSSKNSYYYIDAINNNNKVIWKSDTLVSSIQLATDMKSPQIQLPVTIKDSMIINSSSFSLQMKISDSSGIGAVLCSLETKGVTVLKENDSIYNLTVTNLKPNVFSTIVVTAEDMSFRRNCTRFVLSVKYNPGPLDTIAPIVKLLNVVSDTIIVSTDTMDLQLICKDAIGITSVVCSLGTKSVLVSKISDSVYTAKLTGIDMVKVNSAVVNASDLSGNITSLKFYVKYDTKKSDVIQQYRVLYDGNGKTGGAVPADTVNYLSGDNVPVKGNTGSLLREGYIFGGWNTQADGTGTKYVSGSELKITEMNITLYAQWNPFSYTVTFSCTDATSEPKSFTQTVTYPLTNVPALPSPAPSRTGYVFAGWWTSLAADGKQLTSATKINADMTVIAKWTINQYKVTFNSQSGSAVDSQIVNYNDTAKTPSVPIRTGYTFGGWFKESACTNPWTFGTDKVTGNVTLFAKWTPNPYNVTFNKNDPSATGSMAQQTITYGISAPLTANGFTKTGYSFAGWATSSGGSVVYANEASYTMATKGDTLYAKWNVTTTTLGHWLFNGSLSDESDNNISSTITGKEEYIDSPRGKALFFDGSNYTNVHDIEFFDNLDNFIIEAWINPTSYKGSTNAIISKVNPNRDFVLYLTSTGQLSFHIAHGATYYHLTSPSVLPINEWSKTSVVKTGTHWELFVNDVSVGEKDFINIEPKWTGSIMNIGAMDNGYSFQGYIDEVKITKLK